MSSEVFAQIRELKQKGQFVDAWNCGFSVFQKEPENAFLRTSLFWVCYAAIKSVQETVLARQGKIPLRRKRLRLQLHPARPRRLQPPNKMNKS